MTLLDALRALRRRWLVLVAALVLAVLTAGTTTPAAPRTGPAVVTYAATATLLATDGSPLDDSGTSGSGVRLPLVRLLVTTGKVPDRAARGLAHKGDPAVLASRVSVTADNETGSLAISTTDSDPREAAALVNAFASATLKELEALAVSQRRAALASAREELAALARQVAELDRRAARQSGSAVRITQAERDAQLQRYTLQFSNYQSLIESPPPGPGFTLLERGAPIPNISSTLAAPATRNGRVGLAGLLALAVAAGLVLLLERLDPRLRRPEAVEQTLGLPVLATLPPPSRRDRAPVPVLASRPASAAAEAVRTLRAGVLPVLPDGRGVVLVTSARRAEGRSTTALELAAALGEAGLDVLLVDLDLRAPRLAAALDTAPAPGSAELLVADDLGALSDHVQTTALLGVRLLPCGEGLRAVGVVARRAEALVQHARRVADVVVVDAGPLLVSSEAAPLLAAADVALVVTRSGSTTRGQLARLRTALDRTRTPVPGAVLCGLDVAVAPGAGASTWQDALRHRLRPRRPAAPAPSADAISDEPDEPATDDAAPPQHETSPEEELDMTATLALEPARRDGPSDRPRATAALPQLDRPLPTFDHAGAAALHRTLERVEP